MIKQNQPQVSSLTRKELYKELAKVCKEIIDLYHGWLEKKVSSDKYDVDNLSLFERKRKIIADISLTYPDDKRLWLD